MVAALVNAVWAAIVSVVPMLGTLALVTLIGPDRPPVQQTVRYSVATWLLAHGIPLTVAGAPFALVPLALTGLAGWRLFRAGRNTARTFHPARTRSPRPAILAAISVGVVYGLLGAAAAIFIRGPGLSVSVPRAGLTAGVFACLAAFAGAGGSALRPRWYRVPSVIRDGVRTGAVASLLVIAAGAIAAGTSIAMAGSTATAALRDYHAGVAGQAGVILVCLVYAPNIATWAAAYLAGPGFTLAGVPELPVFAGLPNRPVDRLGQLLLLVPVLAGLVAGVLLASRKKRQAASTGGKATLRATVGATVLGGVVSGALLAASGYLAAGSLGTGLLAHTGQVGWQFAVVSGVGIALGATLGAATAVRP